MLGLAVVACVLAAGVQPGEQPARARARLLSERPSLQPGTTAWLGVSFDIDEDWHLYWNGLSDTGKPPILEPDFPAGYKAGAPQWPAPHRHISQEYLDHVYEDRVTILIPVEVPKDAKPGEKAEFKVHANWLVCKSICLMEEADLTVTVPVAAAQAAPTQESEKVFGQARGRIPKALDNKKPEITLSWEGDHVKIRSSDPAKGMAFYPSLECATLPELRVQGESKTDTLDLKVEKAANSRLVGVVEIEPQEKGRHIVYAVDAAIPAAGDSGDRK